MGCYIYETVYGTRWNGSCWKAIRTAVQKPDLMVHRLLFTQQQFAYHSALNTAHKNYYSSIIGNAATNSKSLFKTVDNLLRPIKAIVNCSLLTSVISRFTISLERLRNYKVL